VAPCKLCFLPRNFLLLASKQASKSPYRMTRPRLRDLFCKSGQPRTLWLASRQESKVSDSGCEAEEKVLICRERYVTALWVSVREVAAEVGISAKVRW
jgi:hypothetical protein